MKKLQLSDFDYNLPERLIAHKPAEPRDHSRLLVFDRTTGSITDSHFYNVSDFLKPNTTLVVNNSKVEKARMLFGKKEVFVVNTVNDTTVEAMIRPGKKFKSAAEVQLSDKIKAKVLHIHDDGLRTLQFNKPLDHPDFITHKKTPFPPYINADESLAERYQTVYAKPDGSKAAPTAGLHFTEGLIKNLKQQEKVFAEVTLHVGLGTFAPVKVEDVENHTLHSEEWILTDQTARLLNQADHITAVGTTSARVLESLPARTLELNHGRGFTDIFIKPGYSFKNVDSLITNFHLPKSTLLMMIAAFMGYEEMKFVYNHAIKEKYRFYSFGDAMLII